MAEAEDPQLKLDELRAEIDKIDYKLLDVLADHIKDRLKVVAKIGPLKRKAGRGITDSDREETVLRDRAEKARSKNISGEMVKKIWKAIIENAKENE